MPFLAPLHDYDPLPGDLPSEVMRQFISLSHSGSSAMICVQEWSSQPLDVDAIIAARPIEKIEQSVIDRPYGEMFTADGFCDIRAYNARMGSPATMIGGTLLIVDTAMQDADHRHVCRPCRERLDSLVQDLEGEFSAASRYSDQGSDE